MADDKPEQTEAEWWAEDAERFNEVGRKAVELGLVHELDDEPDEDEDSDGPDDNDSPVSAD